jgi:hypothetical protein
MSEQGTPEWFAKRCGKFTGSRFAAVMARSKTTGKPLKAYDDLIWQLVVERLTGSQDEGFDSYATRWGKDLEGYARQEYELTSGMMVVEVDFIDHPTLPFVGCSPDGLAGLKSSVRRNRAFTWSASFPAFQMNTSHRFRAACGSLIAHGGISFPTTRVCPTRTGCL